MEKYSEFKKMLEGENAVADVNAEFQDANLNKEKNAENEFRQE